MTVHCEMPAGKNHCPWNDNGYCHYLDEREVKKRELLAQVNDLPNYLPVCRQHFTNKERK